MSDIHDLIVRVGRDAAKAIQPPSMHALFDTAANVLAEESEELGFTYSGFCITALPHRKLPDKTIWERRVGKFMMVVEPGILVHQGQSRYYGIPYGSKARLIMLYLQKRAIQTNSREITLGRSMNDWMTRMGIPSGGTNIRDVRDQALRISACNLMFSWTGEAGDGFRKSSIVEEGFMLHDSHCDLRQGQLWDDTVVLSEGFFRALKDHPVPIWEPAVREISNQSAAIDIYIWLAYRLRSLKKSVTISWAALHQQFGAGFKHLKHFKAKFLDRETSPLHFALAVYPGAKVEIDDKGMVLHPSLSPVPERPRLITR